MNPQLNTCNIRNYSFTSDCMIIAFTHSTWATQRLQPTVLILLVPFCVDRKHCAWINVNLTVDVIVYFFIINNRLPTDWMGRSMRSKFCGIYPRQSPWWVSFFQFSLFTYFWASIKAWRINTSFCFVTRLTQTRFTCLCRRTGVVFAL